MKKGAKIGLIIGGVAVLGAVAFLIIKKSKNESLGSEGSEEGMIDDTCPDGFRPYGDGSACLSNKNSSHRCALWGNESLPRCSCPKDMEPFGDGSACKNVSGTKKCAKWGNPSLERC